MYPLLLGIAAFCLALAIHVFWWRLLHVPTRPLVALIKIFILSFLLMGAFAWFFIWRDDPTAALQASLLALLLYFPASLSYLVAYTGIEAESPSSIILLALRNSESKSLSRASLKKFFPPDLFVKDRLAALVHEGCITIEHNRVHISKHGRRVLFIFGLPWLISGTWKVNPQAK